MSKETIETLFNYLKDNDFETEFINKINQFYKDNPLKDKILDFDWIKNAIEKIQQDTNKEGENIEHLLKEAGTIFKRDGENDHSAIKKIQENIDLADFLGKDDSGQPKLQELGKNGDKFWNESVRNLIYNWVNNYYSSHSLENLTRHKETIPSDNIIPTDWNDWTIHSEEITLANAVYDFGEEYVNPSLNFNSDENENSFYAVITKRTNEKDSIYNSIIYNVNFELKNENYYQNTNQYYINLLMPKNSRRVGVADLNRNFWVISQNLSYLCRFLFGSGTRYTFSGIMNSIIQEIVELWENMIYLWAALYTLYGYEEHPLHVEYIYLPNDKYCTSRKFDNFNFWNLNDGSSFITRIETIKDRFMYMKKRYPQCNLCIIPIVRVDNYESNYYSTEWYPGMLLSSYNDSTFNYIQFKKDSGLLVATVNEDMQRQNSNYVFLNGVGYNENNFGNYNCTYIYPFSYIDDLRELNSQTYFCAFRPTFLINYAFENGKLIIKENNLQIAYTDVIRNNMKEETSQEFYGNFYNINEYQYDFYNSENNKSELEFSFNLLNNLPNYTIDSNNLTNIKKKRGTLTKKYYEGECLSRSISSDSTGFALEKEIIPLIPSYGNTNIIKNTDENDPNSDKNLYETNQLNKIISKEEYENAWSSLTNNDKYITEYYSKDKYKIDELELINYSMGLTIGEHYLAFWGSGINDYDYYKLYSNKIKKDKMSCPDHHAYTLYSGATLFNPLTGNHHSYKDYIFYSTYAPGGNWISYINKQIYEGYQDQYAYLYVFRGNQLKSNNWVLRYVETCGTLSYKNEEISFLPSEFWEHEWNSLFDTELQIKKNIKWNIQGIPDDVQKQNPMSFTYKHDLYHSYIRYYGVDEYNRSSQIILDIIKLKKYIQNNKSLFFKKAIEYRNAIVQTMLYGTNISIKGKKIGEKYYFPTTLRPDAEHPLKNYVQAIKIINPYNREELNYYKTTDEYTQYVFFPYKPGTTSGELVPNSVNYAHYFLDGSFAQRVDTDLDSAASFITNYEVVESNYILKGYLNNEWKKLPLLSSLDIIQKNIEIYCKDLIESCDEWIRRYKNIHNSLIKTFNDNKDIYTSPIYSKIKTHLFFSSGDYTCMEQIQYGDSRESWNYYKIYDNNPEDNGSTYNGLREQLIENIKDKENVPINSYILYRHNAKRKRTVSGKEVEKFLDYEKYPITGTETYADKAIEVPYPYSEST